MVVIRSLKLNWKAILEEKYSKFYELENFFPPCTATDLKLQLWPNTQVIDNHNGESLILTLNIQFCNKIDKTIRKKKLI